ncbi:transmembrane protein [Ceratobasidium sp. AG-Ba]|nr:transmembrane protein [Ceratobasidium sp. AG-Ba]QRW10727.1 transmembrane protein [Ceratobasidium sp. AG-Ba]
MGRLECENKDILQWGLQQTPGQRPVCHTCLTTGQSIGLAFSTQAGVISFISVIALGAIVVFKYKQASNHLRERFFASYLDVFMTNLFLSELLMSLGGVLDAKWANESQVYCGGYCDAQGSLQFLGETSVSIWTLAITLYTWWSVTGNKRLNFRPLLCYGIVAAVWVYVFAFNFGSYATVNPVDDDDEANYFTPTPFWCWVNSKYSGNRVGEYFWLWLAGVGNIVVYVPLYLLLRGNLVIHYNPFSVRLYRIPPPPQEEVVKPDNDSSVASTEDESDQEDTRKDAFKLLWYPIVYTILVLPLSLVRWMGSGNTKFNDPQVPARHALAAAQLIFHALYRLSGVVNVGLVLSTRPNVLLLGKRDREAESAQEDQIPRAAGRSGTNNGIPLRQRVTTAQNEEEEQQGGNRFGGQTVILNRGEEFGGR